MKKSISIILNLLIISNLSMAQSVTLAPTNTANPTKGTVVFNNGTNQLQYWNGTFWISITNAASGTGWALNGNDISNNNSGNVGISTNTPKATLNVGVGKTVLFGIDSSGSGSSKLIWYPSKGAFRAGYLSLFVNPPAGNAWDYQNVGFGSAAMGTNAVASGTGSTATGWNTNATATCSVAMGYTTFATGDYTTALGRFTNASSAYATAIGTYNQDIANALLMVGNGNSNTRSNALTVLSNGNVGIGTSYPIVPLHISSSQLLNETNNHYFSWATGSSLLTLANGNYYVGALIDYDVVTRNSFVSSQTVTSSDARIKNIVGISDSRKDLNKIMQIKITDYQYKDVVNRGNQTFKKVIAQQVESVYPEAVKRITSTIPDIYSISEKVVFNKEKNQLTVSLSNSYDIKIGEKIEMIHPEKGKIQAVVAEVSGNSFTVKDWQFPTDKVFVFGREVNDFRTVDYEAISMLGISAIQQLVKENEELKKEMTWLKTNFSARLTALENASTKRLTVETR